MAERSLIAVVTPAFGSTESVEALAHEAGGRPTEVRLVAPAIEADPLHHTLGDVDEPRVERRIGSGGRWRPCAGPGSR